ncbi:MAG: hypothetical protein JWO67_5888, partial [Streptosporangiaceae bacterium]|nr:hypothetical protein [Streptosporangiaceae bacterium]
QTAAMPGAGSAARTTAMPRTRTNGMPPVLPPSERPAASPGSYDRRGRSGGGAGMFLAALALVVVACLVGFGAWALKHNSGGTGGGGAVPTVTVTDPTTSAPATRPTDVPNPTIGNRTPLRHPPGQVVPSRTRSSHTGPAHTSHPVTTPSGPQTSAPPQTPGPVGTP